jgi:tetratricopeptide (TPR) repeat protein
MQYEDRLPYHVISFEEPRIIVSNNPDLTGWAVLEKYRFWIRLYRYSLAFGIISLSFVCIDLLILKADDVDGHFSAWRICWAVATVAFFLMARYARKRRRLPVFLRLGEAIAPAGIDRLFKASMAGFERELEEHPKELADGIKNEANSCFLAGEQHYKAHRYKDAAKHYEKSVHALPTVSGYFNIGVCHYILSEFPSAADAYHMGLKIAGEQQDWKIVLGLGHNIYEVYRIIGKPNVEWKKASELIDKALEFECSTIPPPETKKAKRKLHEECEGIDDSEDAYYKLDLIALRGSDDEWSEEGDRIRQRAWERHLEELEVHRKSRNLPALAEGLGGVCAERYLHGLIVNSEVELRQLKEVLSIYQEIGNRRKQAQVLVDIAGVYGRNGDLEKAIEQGQQALAIYEQVGDLNNQANCLNWIGYDYGELGQAEKKIGCFMKCLEIRRQMNDEAAEASVLISIGGFYREQGNTEEALEYLENGLKILKASKEYEDSFAGANASREIGMVYADQGKRREALKLLRRARAIYRREISDSSHLLGAKENIRLPYLSEVEEKIRELKKDRGWISTGG